MKLQQINENLLALQQIRGALNRNGPFFYRPHLNTSMTYGSFTGHDAGAMTGGMTFLPSGTPHKPRHRAYLGMEKRPGAIRL
jgi:hypothetical protein